MPVYPIAIGDVRDVAVVKFQGHAQEPAKIGKVCDKEDLFISEFLAEKLLKLINNLNY
jgi:hypothetical protein